MFLLVIDYILVIVDDNELLSIEKLIIFVNIGIMVIN